MSVRLEFFQEVCDEYGRNFSRKRLHPSTEDEELYDGKHTEFVELDILSAIDFLSEVLEEHPEFVLNELTKLDEYTVVNQSELELLLEDWGIQADQVYNVVCGNVIKSPQPVTPILSTHILLHTDKDIQEKALEQQIFPLAIAIWNAIEKELSIIEN